jgi:hypothetical protein
MSDCPICKTQFKFVFDAKVLRKYDVKYYQCPSCELLQSEKPHWLEEAYQSAIIDADTGLVQRNIQISRKLASALYFLLNKGASYLDVAGGYGMFTRLMRDYGFHSDVVDRIMDISLATEDRWNQSQSKHPTEKHIAYKEAKEFYESKKFKISLTNEYLIETEFKLADAILPYLHARNWQLVTTRGNDNVFITSDNPVKLAWNTPDSIPPFFRESPGFGLPNTTVYFPLTKNHFLIGRFDKPSGYSEGSHALVCASNGQTIGYMRSQIFSPSSDARVFDEDKKVMKVGDIFKAP